VPTVIDTAMKEFNNVARTGKGQHYRKQYKLLSASSMQAH